MDGVIDWTLTYRSNLEMRGKWRLANVNKVLKDDDPMRHRFVMILHQGKRPVDR